MIKGYKFEVRKAKQTLQGEEKIVWIAGYVDGTLFNPVQTFDNEHDAHQYIKENVQTDEE